MEGRASSRRPKKCAQRETSAQTENVPLRGRGGRRLEARRSMTLPRSGSAEAARGEQHGVDAGLDGAEVAGGVVRPKFAQEIEVVRRELVRAQGDRRIVRKF